MHIHTPLLLVFVIVTAVLTLGIITAWVWALVQKLRGVKISYKTHGKFLTITYVLMCVAIIYLIILIQQFVVGCADVSKDSIHQKCYDLNEFNWGWLSVALVAVIGVVSVVMLLIAFHPKTSPKLQSKQIRKRS